MPPEKSSRSSSVITNSPTSRVAKSSSPGNGPPLLALISPMSRRISPPHSKVSSTSNSTGSCEPTVAAAATVPKSTEPPLRVTVPPVAGSTVMVDDTSRPSMSQAELLTSGVSFQVSPGSITASPSPATSTRS